MFVMAALAAISICHVGWANQDAHNRILINPLAEAETKQKVYNKPLEFISVYIAPTHGKLTSTYDSNFDSIYTRAEYAYEPDNNFEGTDHLAFMVKINNKPFIVNYTLIATVEANADYLCYPKTKLRTKHHG